MKRNLKLIAVVLLFSVASCSFTTKSFDDPDKDKTLLDLISYLLERGHYDAKDINDEFSAAVFDDYIDALDPYRRFFYKKDIEEFEKYKDQIDDAIRDKDLTFFDLTYTRLMERTKEANEIQADLLEKPFDFTEDEILDTDYEKQPFAKNKKELKNRWRQQLKLNALSSYFDKKEEQEKTPEEGEEVVNTDEPKEILSDKQLEEKARNEVKDNTKEFFEFTDELERQDYFAIFLNAVVEEFDPHTYYFAPVAKDRFDTQMSGQFQGIGARLQKKNGEIKITDVISGGPAWRGDELREGDVIMRVRQEDEKDAISIVGMRLQDAIEYIKGPKGTKVILTVKTKLDGSTQNITIERDIVELEETYAKSAEVEKDGKKYGIVNLPKFYFTMDDYKEKNAASDVKKEIERLKEEGMEGLVIDLRNNGGGSLKTVVDIAGLFIKNGPIVQVASSGDEPEVLEDADPSILWDGPLVILVNEISASASEILAAAMQDYKRAIIIGGKQTYGKGTVQNVADLNQYLRKNPYGDLGALKLTTQKFYRVNGGSTQLEGVKSDVVVPDRFKYIDIGERDQENPLPWDKIKAASYDVWDGYVDFDETIENSVQRMSKSEHLQLVDDYAKWIKDRRDDQQWSLNYEKYKERIAQSEEFAKKFDAIDDYDTKLSYKSLPYEQKLFESDTILKEKRDRWHKSLTKDAYVEEALNVLKDLKINNIRKDKLAAIKD
ncbi:tail-specific protease [Dokdonia sp. Dokd-P16]|uniref:carboxy terminal-processing peptidase n=1 Tax=Dokdonia sp. Dokd-P16 TaxID=2173169 RepID=UPI000D549634|nr:carboxy terminal-processing peptidase [Dokdonia sp. Dokd-P16]AWH75677.1 tail-specific protease [Dokdonia sp. Dokd-P16]